MRKAKGQIRGYSRCRIEGVKNRCEELVRCTKERGRGARFWAVNIRTS